MVKDKCRMAHSTFSRDNIMFLERKFIQWQFVFVFKWNNLVNCQISIVSSVAAPRNIDLLVIVDNKRNGKVCIRSLSCVSPITGISNVLIQIIPVPFDVIQIIILIINTCVQIKSNLVIQFSIVIECITFSIIFLHNSWNFGLYILGENTPPIIHHGFRKKVV